jgi:hypothetical protein
MTSIQNWSGSSGWTGKAILPPLDSVTLCFVNVIYVPQSLRLSVHPAIPTAIRVVPTGLAPRFLRSFSELRPALTSYLSLEYVNIDDREIVHECLPSGHSFSSGRGPSHAANDEHARMEKALRSIVIL